MNKTELISAMAEKSGLQKREAELALKAFTECVIDELKKGEKVQLIGFGTFETAVRNERTALNPKTKETITLPKQTVPKFKFGKAVKDIVK